MSRIVPDKPNQARQPALAVMYGDDRVEFYGDLRVKFLRTPRVDFPSGELLVEGYIDRELTPFWRSIYFPSNLAAVLPVYPFSLEDLLLKEQWLEWLREADAAVERLKEIPNGLAHGPS